MSVSHPSTFIPSLYKFNHNAALPIQNYSQTPNPVRPQRISSAAYPGQSTSHHLTSSFSKVPTCLQPILTRRTSGHCLVNFISVNISFPCNKCSVSTPQFLKTYTDNTFISRGIRFPVAIRNFTIDKLPSGIFVSRREEEGVNCVVKSFISCEIHEGI